MKHTYDAPAQHAMTAQSPMMFSFEKSQKKRRTRSNTTATRKMTMGTKAIRSERALAVAKSRLHSLTSLKAAEAIFYFADEFHELRLGDDLGMPAEVALDQVVGFDDMRTGQRIASRVMVAAHEPEVVGDGSGGGDVVGDHDD